MPPRNRPQNSISAEVLAAIEGAASSAVESAVKAVESTVKAEVGVLKERLEGQSKLLESKFGDLERRQERDIKILSDNIAKDARSIEELSKDVKELKGVVGQLQTQFTGPSNKLTTMETTVVKLREEVDLLKSNYYEGIGVKKTLNWLWASSGISLVGIVGLLMYLMYTRTQ
jgi:uncharacterized coiled-coil protein SlyX